jgi:hypothetical protein
MNLVEALRMLREQPATELGDRVGTATRTFERRRSSQR